MSYATLGGSKSPPGKQTNMLDEVSLKHLMALDIPKVCASVTKPCIPNNLVNAFSDFQLADDYKNNSYPSIDILVGLDAYWGFMDSEIKPHQSNGLVAKCLYLVGCYLAHGWFLLT